MSYNTKAILKDVNSKPIPQFYNPTADVYNFLTGVDLGGGRYGSDGLMWGKTAGGVYVPVTVNASGNLVTAIDSSALPTGAATSAKQDNIISGISAVGINVSVSIISGSKTVSTSQVGVFAGVSVLANRRGVRVRCVGNDAVYIGPSGVTTSTGYPVLPGEDIAFLFSNATATAIYAIAASSQTVKILEWS
jgi:hypothetical protein